MSVDECNLVTIQDLLPLKIGSLIKIPNTESSAFMNYVLLYICNAIHL